MARRPASKAAAVESAPAFLPYLAAKVEGIHLDADQHALLGRALAVIVSPLLV